MAANLKGRGGVKGLFLLHGEKLLIGAVAIVAAMIVFKALGVERLSADKQADKLATLVKQTRNNIESPENNWNRAVAEHPGLLKIHDKLAERNATLVDGKDYPTPKLGIDEPVLVQDSPRTDPTLLAASGVVAKSGADLFVFIDPETSREAARKEKEEEARKAKEATRGQDTQPDSGGRPNRGNRNTRPGRGGDPTKRGIEPTDAEHPTRRMAEGGGANGGVQLVGDELIELSHWVAVVAKVPVKAQRSLYYDAFEKARGGFNSEADFPRYLGYLVQRAEVVPGQPALQWQDIPVYDAKGSPPPRQLLGKIMCDLTMRKIETATKDWGQNSETEVVDSSFLDPLHILAYPLPPVLGRSWGAEATHPDIPLAADFLADSFTEEQAVEETPTTPVQGDELGIGVQPQGFPGEGRTERNFRAGGREDRGRGTYTQRGTRGNVTRGRSVGDNSRGREAGQNMLPPGVSDYLLRFYDFTATPGKKYKYRIQMLMSDPNQAAHVTQSMLDQSVIDRIKKLPKADGRPISYLRTAWSDPTPTVGVPFDGTVRVEDVRISSGAQSDEPHVKLLVESFGKEPKTGTWIQGTQDQREFARGGVVNFIDDAEYLISNGNSSYIDKVDKFNFSTGITVLDIRGGERLPGRDLTVPSRVLVMDPAGELSVRREMDDAAAVQQHRDVFTKKKPGSSEPTSRGGGRRG